MPATVEPHRASSTARARPRLRWSSPWPAAVLLSLGACSDRLASDELESHGDPAMADDSSDPNAAPGSLASQGITVFSEYYEGRFIRLDFTTDPQATCAFRWPVFDRCGTLGSWYVTMEGTGPAAAPGALVEPDLSYWNAKSSDETVGLCGYVLASPELLDDMRLTIEQATPSGLIGHVDELGIAGFPRERFSGGFLSVPCE